MAHLPTSGRREWLPTAVFLPGESHGQRSLGGYSPWGCKESDTTERLNTPPGCLSKQTGVFLIMHLSSQQQTLSTPIYIWICSRLPCFSRIPPPHDPRPPFLCPGWLQQPPQRSLRFYLVPPSTKSVLHSEDRTLFKGTKKIALKSFGDVPLPFH